jgi:hypothetical protein
MPKLTRDELLKKALNRFMLDFDVTMGTDIDGLDETINYCIKDYEIHSMTENKTRFIQNYELTIPEEIIIGYQEITNIDNDEETLWEENEREPIYGEHSVPTLKQFCDVFNEHFRPYRLYEGRKLLSHIGLMNIPTDNKVSGVVINIQIIYHKSHTPFPRPLTELETYKNENDMLYTKISAKNKRITALRKQLEQDAERANINYNRLQTHFRTLYGDSNTIEECPVCYDIIVPDKLIVPGCLHKICIDCVIKCESCPLCRDKYDQYIESDPLTPF